MNIQQLKIFLSVCSGLTLQETADKLGLKQPTISFHLRKLEETLGVELWYRNARGFRPTAVAEELLPYARRIVSLTEEAEARVGDYRERTGGRLRIGASHTPATYFIPPHLAQFRVDNPRVQLLLTVKKAKSMLEMLRNCEVEAAIVSLPADDATEGLIVHRLAEDELRLFFSPFHPLALWTEVTVEQLRKETFLLHEPDTTSRRLTDEWGAKVGLRFNEAMELGAIETIKEGLKCNMGVGALPWRSAARETEAGELAQRPLPNYENNRYICLVYRDEELLSPQLKQFVDFILQRMRPFGQ